MAVGGRGKGAGRETGLCQQEVGITARCQGSVIMCLWPVSQVALRVLDRPSVLSFRPLTPKAEAAATFPIL